VIGRRAFVAGSSLLLSCDRTVKTVDPPPSPPPPAPPVAAALVERSTHALFDAHPALAKTLPRTELGHFPSRIDQAKRTNLWTKRDDLLGGGKTRKLELYFGDAKAAGKTRIVTSGGTGSNQAVAVARFGRAHGFDVGVYLAPQPLSSLVATNLAADAALGAEVRRFPSVIEAHSEALREAKERGDTYVIPPGGTTPLGTLGFVSAGLELARDVESGRMPAPRRVYVALGLGGTSAGLAIGLALAGMKSEVVAVRTSNPTSVTLSTLRAIHEETMSFLRARDASVPAIAFHDVHVHIDPRWVGGGYGFATPAGDAAILRARDESALELDPVYTGKAFAAVLDDDTSDPLLFWNTASHAI